MCFLCSVLNLAIKLKLKYKEMKSTEMVEIKFLKKLNNQNTNSKWKRENKLSKRN